MSAAVAKAHQTRPKIQRNYKVAVQYVCPRRGLPTRELLDTWVGTVLRFKSCTQVQLTLRIVDFDEGRTLNETYRGKNGPTNVLSFPYEGPAFIVEQELGDIVICAPVVALEAQQQNKNLSAHWAHLVVHGLLHLLGYDHIKKSDARIMEAAEINILKQLGFPDPYLAVNDLMK